MKGMVIMQKVYIRLEHISYAPNKIVDKNIEL